MAAAVARIVSGVRGTITRVTPLRASEKAHARPSPLLAAHTIACRPVMPRSMPPFYFLDGRTLAKYETSVRILDDFGDVAGGEVGVFRAELREASDERND